MSANTHYSDVSDLNNLALNNLNNGNQVIDFTFREEDLLHALNYNLERLLLKAKLITPSDLVLAYRIQESTNHDIFLILKNLLIINEKILDIGHKIVRFMFYTNIDYAEAIALFKYCYNGNQDVAVCLEQYAKIHQLTSYLKYVK